MLKFIKMLFNKKLRCKEYGHQFVLERRETYRYSRSYTAVADNCVEKRTVCKRCKDVFTEWDITSSNPIQGLTLDSDRMDEFNKNHLLETGSRSYEPLPPTKGLSS